jgi:hypothetical protein
MWSLPDIKALNENAGKFNATLEHVVSTGKNEDGEPLTCDWAEHDSQCQGEVHTYKYYDIFSDVPKGFLTLCDYHDGRFGNPSEGYFTCDACGRVFIENHTWEMYRHDGEDGTLCLNCHCERELSDENNWLKLTKRNIDALTFYDVRRAKHLIAVGQDTPKELKFIGNVEMDSMSGGRLTGFSSCEETPDGAVEEVKELLRDAKQQGYRRAILVLDGAYQFSVSIGVYTDAKKVKARKAQLGDFADNAIRRSAGPQGGSR